MLRVISELRPTWVVGENVAGIVNMALDQVCADLEGISYAVQTFIVPACAVDAPHRRDRCAILAYTDGGRQLHWRTEKHPAEAGKYAQRESVGRGTNVADASLQRLEKPGMQGQQEKPGVSAPDRGRGPAQPGLGGVADGISPWLERGMSTPGCWAPEPEQVPRVTRKKKNRADRLKCLGNAVVPQQFYPVFQAIADIGRGIIHG